MLITSCASTGVSKRCQGAFSSILDFGARPFSERPTRELESKREDGETWGGEGNNVDDGFVVGLAYILKVRHYLPFLPPSPILCKNREVFEFIHRVTCFFKVPHHLFLRY